MTPGASRTAEATPGLPGLNVVRPRAARCGRSTLTPLRHRRSLAAIRESPAPNRLHPWADLETSQATHGCLAVMVKPPPASAEEAADARPPQRYSGAASMRT
jgi:hypothetical protein